MISFSVSILTILFLAQGVLAVDCTTSKCHGDLATQVHSQKNIHGPFKSTKKFNGCEVCHSSEGVPLKDAKLPADHPRLINARGPKANETCVTCHDDVVDNKHKAVEEKGCVSCHDPHGSNNDKLLRGELTAQKQCLECHKDLAKELAGRRFHTGETKLSTCLECHDAHGTKHAKLLKKTGREQCLSCHDGSKKNATNMKALIASTGHYHGVTAKKSQGVDCGECHKSHVSDHASLLKGHVLASKGPTARSKDPKADYGLCFQCHKDLFDKTKFRDGAKNLHVFHVQRKKKSYGCFACHDPHTSKNRFLVKDSFNYYGREVEMRFQETKNGGTCATACHAKLGYER